MGGLGLTLFVLGILLGWTEMVAAAATCAMAFGVAVPYVVGRPTVELTRRPSTTRITPGADESWTQTAISIEVQPRTRFVPRLTIEEDVSLPGFEVRPLRFRQLSANEKYVEQYTIPTHKRGVIDLGPARIARRDPFGIFNRDVEFPHVDRIWIHPRTVELQMLSSGFASDLEGPTFDTSPAGDVAFHTVRDYVDGDNFRHIHWPSTARRVDGTLMVRHYVDNRRPIVGVYVDNDPSRIGVRDFEAAMELAASIATSSLEETGEGAAYVGSDYVFGVESAQTESDLLDRFAEAALAPEGSAVSIDVGVAGLIASEPAVSTLVVITGAVDFAWLADQLADLFAGRVLPVSVSADGFPNVGSDDVIRVADLQEFAMAWSELA